MTKQELTAQVIAIVAEQLDRPVEAITPASRFVEDLEADSLDTIELIMEFEDRFEVRLPDEDAEKIDTVQQAVDYLAAKLEIANA
ncbi:MAG: acyl carrier protein [Phycisphaerae bacterium]|nr:acyl carrier protein [Phycisphaerae bacterium]